MYYLFLASCFVYATNEFKEDWQRQNLYSGCCLKTREIQKIPKGFLSKFSYVIVNSFSLLIYLFSNYRTRSIH